MKFASLTLLASLVTIAACHEMGSMSMDGMEGMSMDGMDGMDMPMKTSLSPQTSQPPKTTLSTEPQPKSLSTPTSLSVLSSLSESSTPASTPAPTSGNVTSANAAGSVKFSAGALGVAAGLLLL